MTKESTPNKIKVSSTNVIYFGVYRKIDLDTLAEKIIILDGIPRFARFSSLQKFDFDFILHFFIEPTLIKEIETNFNVSKIDEYFGNISLTSNLENLTEEDSEIKIIYIAFENHRAGRVYVAPSGLSLHSALRISIQKKNIYGKYSEVAFCQKPVLAGVLSNQFIEEYLLNQQGRCSFVKSRLKTKQPCSQETINDKFFIAYKQCLSELKDSQ